MSVLSGQAVGSPAVKVYFLTGVLMESMIPLSLQRNYRISYGKMEFHLTMSWIIYHEPKIYLHCMRKQVGFIYTGTK